MQNQTRPDREPSIEDPGELLEAYDIAEETQPADDENAARKANLAFAKTLGLTFNPNLCGIVMDSQLTILYATPRVKALFADYCSICAKPFFNVFHRSLEPDGIRDLHVSLNSFARGFTWTGTLRHKTPATRTLFTKTNILPIFSEDRSIRGFLAIFEDITESYRSQLQTTFKGILEAAKLKDNDTGLHDQRVGYYCKKMCEYLFAIKRYPQIDPDFIDNIMFLGAMHDVGKIGTPDYILQKPGRLSDQEWEIMREHTINGTFILSSYPEPMAKEISLSHHEWWNGTGYPFKLEGEMIPLSARIVTIADVYDALRMKRTYKSELTHDEAVRKILAGKGTQFDPDLIDVFERIHPDFDDIWNLLKDNKPFNPDSRDRSKEFSDAL